MGCFNSHPAPASAPDPQSRAQVPRMETPGTFSSDPVISRSWVYFKIMDNDTNPEVFYAYNLSVQKSLRFPDLPEWRLNTATAFLNGKLYVIGGIGSDGYDSKKVYMCDPMDSFTWSQLPSTQTPRRNAVAVATKGKIYVFGGCSNPYQENVDWAEVYDPSTSTPQWTAIPHPPLDFACSLSQRPLQVVVARHRILIRNDCSRIAYNVPHSSWEAIPPVISNHWFKWPSPAAEVSGMFIGYHQEGAGTAALQAYDRGRDGWFPLDPCNPLDPAETVQLLSVNGNLVAYHVGNSPSQLTFTVMRMQISPTDDRIAVHVSNTLSYLPESADWNFTGPGHAGNP